MTILAFGTFDLFHPGHEFFLTQARALGDRLVVRVARDVHVGALKHKTPGRNEQRRLATIKGHPAVDDADLSDEVLGTYVVLDDVRPDMIAIGHDQQGLQADLERHMRERGIDIPMTRLPKHAPPHLD